MVVGGRGRARGDPPRHCSALRDDATRERLLGAERAAEAVRETWRGLEELNLAPQLALEALFVQLARELAA